MKMRMFRQTGLRVTMLALCTAALSSGSLIAQDSSAPAAQPEHGMRMGRPGPERMQERHLEMMTKELNLTPDQVTQIRAIHADMNKQMLALRDDTTTAQADKHEKMMGIRKDSQGKVRSVLTDEQKMKFDAMEARMRERRDENKEGNGATPPAPPQ